MLQEEKPTLIREQKLSNRTPPRQKSIFSRSFHIVDILRQHALICKKSKIVLFLDTLLFPTG